jgi:hypothetical protein
MSDDVIDQVAERLASNSWDTYIHEPVPGQPRDWMTIADTILLDGRCVAKALLALRRRVAELEATAARRLELLRELRDSFCAAAKLPCREPNVKIIREMGHYLRLLDRVDAEISAAAEVAAGEK